ncbi:MAG: M20/M25/M40 family metallo-hydrolase [Oscillospiraceae bacterium]|nr:M20/M25/M40 family metallo-hydrolase [Oscillospiraceae bacterium]
MDLIKTLEHLSTAPGPAGAEDGARQVAIDLLAPYVDQVTVDALGSVMGHKSCGKPDAPHIVVEAHLDEVGFVVTGVKDTFLTLTALGGIDARLLPGAQLLLLSDPPKSGVIACLPPHVLSPEAMKKGIALDDLALDLGLTEEEAKAIPLGTPVVYDTVPIPMGDGLFCGKSLDNRASVATILFVLDQFRDKLDQVDLTILFSVQEELGCRGASPALFALEPDYCIVLDVTFAHTPDTDKFKTFPMGSGAAIGVSPMLNRDLTERLKRLATEQDIPHQIEVMPAKTGTTADMSQISRTGIPTALISLPIKYMHNPREIVALADIKSVASLLAALLEDMGGRHHA